MQYSLVCLLLAGAGECFSQRFSFQPPVSIPVTYSFRSPYSVATGDLNGDGLPEIVIGQYPGTDILVIAGSQDRLFRPPTRIAAGGTTGSLAIADFDGDGVADVIGGCAGSGSNGYLLLAKGYGDLTFGTPFRVELGGLPNGLVAADLNGDGMVDLAATVTSGVAVLLGKGGGEFDPVVLLSLAERPVYLKTDDFDGDGIPDLLAASSSTMIAVLRGTGAGTFADAIYSSATQDIRGLAVADLEGDGRPDLVVGSHSPYGLTILRGEGDGRFSTFSRIEERDTQITTIGAADLNGDGLADIVTGHYYSGEVQVYFNDTGGTFSAPVGLTVMGDMFAMAIADLNADGAADLIIPSYSASNVAMIFGSGDGSFPETRYLGSLLSETLTGDWNGDGAPDSAVLNWRASSIHVLARGTEHVAELSVDANPHTAVTADFNGDGIPDIAVSGGPSNWIGSNPPRFLWVFLGNGDFTFRALARIRMEDSSSGLAVGDFDGDGMMDVASAGADRLTVARGKGDGTFDKPAEAFGTRAPPVTAADFNRDGVADLLVENSAGKVSVLLNGGDGRFRQGEALDAVLQKGSMTVADLNADGIQDVVVARVDDVQVFLGKGDGRFGTASVYARASSDTWMPPSWRPTGAPTVADVDGDGVPDIVVPNGIMNWADILPGIGDGTFGAAVTVPAGDYPYFLAAGDFDGDGKTDLLFSNVDAGTVTVLKTAVPQE